MASSRNGSRSSRVPSAAESGHEANGTPAHVASAAARADDIVAPGDRAALAGTVSTDSDSAAAWLASRYTRSLMQAKDAPTRGRRRVGIPLPVWMVFVLGGMLVVIGIGSSWLVRWQGWLRGEALDSEPGRALRPVMVKLPEGRFWMGSPDDEPGHIRDEAPVHWVRVSAFDMCQTEVTVSQWRAVTGTEPSDCKYGCEDDMPVHDVSWLDAIDYLNRLTELENPGRAEDQRLPLLTPCYDRRGDTVEWDTACTGYRLPTEAEWEYAVRARSTTAYSFSDNPAQLKDHAWFDENAGDGVRPVKRKEPNAWRLYDMHGNVWEWVWDEYLDYRPADYDNPQRDPPLDILDDNESPVATPGTYRVLRGGSFAYWARFLRSALRNRGLPASRSGGLGFRCARGAPSLSR